MCEILSYITWENAKAFADSAFVTSLVGSLAGAFAGAYAAQRIAERAKDKEFLLTQLRNTNASIITAFSICNTLLAFKKQHVKEITALLQKQKELFIEHHRKISTGENVAQLRLQFDLRNIESPRVPVAVLQNLLFDRISVTGRPLALVSTLQQTIESLERSVTARNNLIEQFKKIDPNEKPQLGAIYFGLPFGGGHIDLQFSDTVTAISRLTDDVIFFSELLIKDLHSYGEIVLDRFKGLSRDTTQSVSAADFDDARKAGLMPDENDYQDWLKGFVKKSSEAS